MKILRTLALLVMGAAGLTGCGDGGVQSPDFTTELRALTLTTTAADDASSATPDQYFLALGLDSEINQIAALGLCNTPPGTDEDDADAISPDGELLVNCGPRDASFRIVGANGGAAHVANGRIIGDAIGTVTVTATEDDAESNSLIFRIGSAIITELQVTPENPPPVSVNEAITFTATGIFSDGTNTPVQADWTATGAGGSALPPGTVTFNAGPSNTTVVTPQPGSQGQTIVITGTIVSDDGNGGTVTESDSSTFTVSNEVLSSLLRIEPANPAVAPGATVGFSAIGQYTGGTAPREGAIPAGQVTWASADTGVATIDPSTGVARGVPPGGAQTTITASLVNPGSVPPGGQTTASTTLTVTDAQCIAPLLQAQGAVASETITGLCVGCAVANRNAAIDGDAGTFATISAPVGLLLGTASLNVDSDAAAPDIAAGSRAGFIVAKPPGLLTAELLSTLSISTRANGELVEAAGANQTTPLGITLLGVIGGQDAALLSFLTTQPFDGVSVTFNTGVASVLPTVNVFQACGNSVNGSE